MRVKNLIALAIVALVSFLACEKDEIIIVDKRISTELQVAKKEYRFIYNDTIPFSIRLNKDKNNVAFDYTPKVKISLVNANGKVFYYDADSVKKEYFTNYKFDVRELDSVGIFNMNLAVTSLATAATRFAIVSEVIYGDKVSRDTVYVNINKNEKYIIDAQANKDTVYVNSPITIRLFVNNTEGEDHYYQIAQYFKTEEAGGTFDLPFPQIIANKQYIQFNYTPTKSGQQELIFVAKDMKTNKEVSTTLVITALESELNMELQGANTFEVKQLSGCATPIIKIGCSTQMYLSWEAIKGNAQVVCDYDVVPEKTDKTCPKGLYEIVLYITPTSLFDNEYKFTLRDELGRTKSLKIYVYRYAIVSVDEKYSSTGAGAYKEGETCNITYSYNKNAYSYINTTDENGNEHPTYFEVEKDVVLTPHFNIKKYTVKLCEGVASKGELYASTPKTSGLQKITDYTLGTFEYGTQITIFSSAVGEICSSYPGGKSCTYYYWYRRDDRDYPICKSPTHSFLVTEKSELGCYEWTSSQKYPQSSEIQQRTGAE